MTPLSSRAVSDLFAEASEQPTPGGGAITILGGYLGVSLILKALRVSRRKKPDAGILMEVTADMEAAAPKLARFADADNESFQAYLDAAKLPKASAEEVAARKAGLSAAAEQAALAAIEAFELGRRLVERAKKAEPDVAPVIRADITAGVELLSTMCIVAKENAEANLPGIADQARRAALAARLG
jgi:formiminotetrahydrofolate cyclodeaminase